MIYSKIIGTGSYLPPRIFTNVEWEQYVETSHQWIVERTGIHARHFAGPDETAATMATQAAKRALEQAGVSANDIQLIIVATGTSDKVFPTTACIVQKNLQMANCIAFDIGAACTGFLYGLSIADQYIKTGAVTRALVIGSEMMSRLIDRSDRNNCVLFGDGAGAVVVQASQTPGILETNLHAQGSFDDLLYVDNAQMGDHSKTSKHLKDEAIDNLSKPLADLDPYVRSQGQKVFKIAVTKFGEMAQHILQKHGLTADQIDWLIPHQANMRIIQAVAEKTQMPMDKVICTLATHGNTSSASVPLALDVAVRDGRVKKGQLILMEAFGAGLTWGSALVKF